MMKLMLVLLFLISGCSRVINRNNPYPGYCTEEPGSGWINIRYSDVAATPDGGRIFFSYAGHGSVLNDTPGVYVYMVEEDSFYAFMQTGWYQALPGMMEVSPDGEWIVFSWGKQIWKVKVNGDSLTQLTFSGENFYPRWSPDGRKIVFHVPLGDSAGIWIINSDGSNKHNIGQWGWNYPDWSPDGGHLIFVDWESNHPVIAYADTLGEGYRILLRGEELDIIQIDGLAYSPDGSKILFVGQRPGEGPMVWVMDADGSNPVPLANGWMPTWYGGNRVLYTNTSNGSIYVMDSNGCNKTPFIGDFNFLEGGAR